MKRTLLQPSIFFLVAVTVMNLMANMGTARTSRPGESLYAGSLHDAVCDVRKIRRFNQR